MQKFYMPTKIYKGRNCVIDNADVFIEFGRKALVVTGTHSAKNNGSLDDVLEVLQINGQKSVLYDRIRANPDIESVYQGAKVARAENCDFIIAIGGGSAMDAAKVISLLTTQEIDPRDLFLGNYKDGIPIVCIPTTAGTGSEVTQYAILTNEKEETKSSVASEKIFPTVSFLDGQYLKGLSSKTMNATVIDALSHCVESYLTKKSWAMSEQLAIQGIHIIAKYFDKLKNRNLADNDLDELLYAATLGGMVIAQTGTSIVHALGYSLTYFENMDHGLANGLLLAEYLRFMSVEQGQKVMEILNAMQINSIDELSILMKQLLPVEPKKYDFEKFGLIAIYAKNIGNSIVKVTYEDLMKMYKNSFQ